LGTFADAGKEVELKDVCGSFSMETIASCAFGVKADSFDPNSSSQFLEYARNVIRFENYYEMAVGLSYLTPLKHVIDALKIPVVKPTETKFFIKLIRDTIRQRMESNTRRNDLVDLMIDAMKGELTDDDDKGGDSGSGNPHRAIDEYMIVATAMVLLVAGYDTTANTMSLGLWRLARGEIHQIVSGFRFLCQQLASLVGYSF
jgi:cytochrome P450